MKPPVRLFLGIPLSAEAKKPLVALQESAKPHLAGWRVLPSDSWHVTLHFLGETDLAKVPPLEKWLRALSIPKLPKLHWNRWVGFPSEKNATVVALAAEAGTAWQKWVKELGGDLTKQGFALEERSFLPHVTLFRRREAGVVTLPTAKPDQPFLPRHVCLYESHLSATGSRYVARVEKALEASYRGDS